MTFADVGQRFVQKHEYIKMMGFVKERICRNCGIPILIMCFQGKEYCSENCRKDLEAEKDGSNQSS